MISAVNIKGLHFKYSDRIILDDIGLDIKRGSFLGILGPNGSGKTTLLRNICNLLKPYKGSILIEKEDIKNISYKDLAKKMAVVHQGANVNFDFSVYDIVLMGRFPYQKRFKTETEYDFDVVKKAMLDTDTWGLREKSIHEISGGERQRVVIARALAQEPEILLLDEPISNLDIKHQISILNLCKKLNEENNITIITTLHDINLAGRYSNYILLLDSGEIKALDEPEKVLTEENIESVYGIKVEVINKSDDKIPYIIPKGL